MSPSDQVKSQLKQLLGKLEDRAENGYGIVSFKAKALGKSKDAIHLAVESGIVSVPLSEISSLAPIPGRGPLEVSVEVKNGDLIKHLRKVPDAVRRPLNPGDLPEIGPVTWPPRVPPGGYPNIGADDGGTSTTSGECNGIDTTTTSAGSGGNPDQTDDYRESCWHDKD